MQNTIFIKKEEMNKIYNILKNELMDIFKPNEKIAVKLHMGEKGNKNFLKPDNIRTIIDILNKLKVKSFLFDSPVAYNGSRDTAEKYQKTAKEHGFDNLGIPIIISDDAIKVKTKHLTVGVCKDLIRADGVLVISHIKGHICSGFGGAIKNLGMGALDKESKNKIHKESKPVYIKNCNLCKECAKNCPLVNIRYDESRPYFDKNWCCGCSNCVNACKRHAIKAKTNTFDKLLAEGAYAALKKFKKIYFINFLINIAKECDCVGKEENPIVLGDIGVVLGKHIIGVEKKSLELINKKAGKDLFKEIRFKSPLVHIEEMEKIMKLREIP
jgi:hypothetical protein